MMLYVPIHQRRDGFTLVEVIIASLLIGLLSAGIAKSLMASMNLQRHVAQTSSATDTNSFAKLLLLNENACRATFNGFTLDQNWHTLSLKNSSGEEVISLGNKFDGTEIATLRARSDSGSGGIYLLTIELNLKKTGQNKLVKTDYRYVHYVNLVTGLNGTTACIYGPTKAWQLVNDEVRNLHFSGSGEKPFIILTDHPLWTTLPYHDMVKSSVLNKKCYSELTLPADYSGCPSRTSMDNTFTSEGNFLIFTFQAPIANNRYKNNSWVQAYDSADVPSKTDLAIAISGPGLSETWQMIGGVESNSNMMTITSLPISVRVAIGGNYSIRFKLICSRWADGTPGIHTVCATFTPSVRIQQYLRG